MQLMYFTHYAITSNFTITCNCNYPPPSQTCAEQISPTQNVELSAMQITSYLNACKKTVPELSNDTTNVNINEFWIQLNKEGIDGAKVDLIWKLVNSSFGKLNSLLIDHF